MARMNRLDILIPQKIGLIQRQDAGQSIGLHNRGKSRIMHLNTMYVVSDYKPPPYRIDFLVIR